MSAVRSVGSTVVLSLHLLRRGGYRAAVAAALLAIGVAAGTLLLTVAAGALHGWDAREARAGWRTGDPDTVSTSSVATRSVSGAPDVADGRVATMRTWFDVADGRSIARVDLIDPDPSAAPPPGLARMPAPGELFVSPALAELSATLRPDALADRLGPVTGVLGAGGLVGPDELVAIRGATATDPTVAAEGYSPGYGTGGAVPVGLASFAAGGDIRGGVGTSEVYRQLTLVAVALVVFPVISLLGASARLGTARRVQRLALLRLLGASTAAVTLVAITEVTVVAVLAAALGVLAAWALTPLLAGIPLAGSTWFAADVWAGAGAGVAIIAVVVALAAVAALSGTREVVLSPLGVVRRTRAVGASVLRVVAAAGAVGIFAVASAAGQSGATTALGLSTGITVLALFAAVLLIAPVVVRVLAARMVAGARSPATLLAGRRLGEDPRAAVRPLAGLVLALFVAGFLAPLSGVLADGSGPDTALRVPVAAGAATDVDVAVRDTLAAARIAATVAVDDVDGGLEVTVTPTVPADRDRVRTALAPLAPGAPIVTAAESDPRTTALLRDLGRGVVAVLVATLAVAAVAVGTATAARVLETRRTLRLLRLAGTPLRVLDATRRRETVRPLLVLGVIGAGAGVLCALPLSSATAVLAPLSLLLLGAVVVVGALLMIIATAASRPILAAVTAPAARAD